MDKKEFLEKVSHIQASEVYGKVLFKTAKSVTFSDDKKQKWQKLYDLEEITLNKLYAYIEANNHQTKISETYWKIKGYIEGIALGLLPWKISMKLLGDGTLPFQKVFLSLKESSNEADMAFFLFVYQHEMSIYKFANEEIKGNSDSLKAVNALLSQK